MRQSLQDGINQLHRAGNDRALLGMALINLHAAMEAHFRAQLANEIAQFEAKEQKRATWQDLINLWEEKRGLPRKDRERLFQHNSLRNDIAHGKPYAISRRQVEAYARFVQDFTGLRVSPDRKTNVNVPPPPQPQPKPPVNNNRGCSCLGRLTATVAVIGLLMGGYFIVNALLSSGQSAADGETGLDIFVDLVEDISGRNEVPPTVTFRQTAVPSATPRIADQSQPDGTSGEDPSEIVIRVLARSNVRAGPGLEYGALGFAPGDGEYVVQETSEDGNWFKIELEPGVTGWIGSSRVERISP